jgi:Ca2+-binding RTX toxin-like protein
LGDGDDYSGFRSNETLDDPQFSQVGNDTIHGGAGKDYIDDYLGSNTLYGGAGNDDLISVDSTVFGDVKQSDKVYGGEGNDLLVGDYGDTLVGGAGQDTMRAFAQVKDNVATTIEGYNAAQDALQINVDPRQANATEWKLASTTNSQTGDVSVFLQNIATPSSVIDLALLKNPTGFQLSQIKLQYDSNPLA